MSVNLRLPFGEYLMAFIREFRKENPGGVSDKMWCEGFTRAHDAWHAARKPKKQPAAPASSEAAKIYALYPRKVARNAALKAISKALKNVPFETLEGAVMAYASITARWRKADRSFIPHPSTWFNDGRWEDDPKDWERDGMRSAFTPIPGSTITEPAGWLQFMMSEYPEWIRFKNETAPTWMRLTDPERTQVIELMAKGRVPA